MAGKAIPNADKQNDPNNDMKSPSSGIEAANITRNQKIKITHILT